MKKVAELPNTGIGSFTANPLGSEKRLVWLGQRVTGGRQRRGLAAHG